jgi:hypothetical protein
MEETPEPQTVTTIKPPVVLGTMGYETQGVHPTRASGLGIEFSSSADSIRWPVGRLMNLPAKPTVAQTLAIALLNGESCEKELIDCLLDETIGVVDWESAAIKKAEEMGRSDQVRIMYGVARELIRVLDARASMYQDHHHAKEDLLRRISIISDFCQGVAMARMKYPTK